MHQMYRARAHETEAGEQTQGLPQAQGPLQGLMTQLPEVADLSALRCWLLHREQLCKRFGGDIMYSWGNTRCVEARERREDSTYEKK